MNRLTILALLFGLSLITKGASVTESFSVAASTTNSIITNSVTITGLSISVASTGPANVEFYDSTNNVYMFAVAGNTTNYIASRQTITTYVTNAIYNFTSLVGHTTNIIKRTTNSTTVLYSTNAVTLGFTNKLFRPLTIIAGTGITTFDDVNAYFGKGVTVATDTNAVVMTITYSR